jgi:hypothetical protein
MPTLAAVSSSFVHWNTMTRLCCRRTRKAKIVYNFFDDLLGTPCSRAHSINLDILVLQLLGLDEQFIEEEVLRVIRLMPLDKALGPDGFTTRFLQQAWDIIRPDLIKAFEAFWHMDTRSFHTINDTLMVLLPKKSSATTMREFQPISLIHDVGKLFSKVLATRLTSHLDKLIHINQSAFMKGCYIQDNFRLVKSSTKLLHARKHLSLLLKVDIARAFDSMSWSFLLEVLRHIGSPSTWLD